MLEKTTVGRQASYRHAPLPPIHAWELEDLQSGGPMPLRIGDDGPPLTVEELTLALSNRIGLEPEELAVEANMVMDIFGFDDRVIDNVLEREDRQLFYTLEEEGMVATDREETTLYDGREWRTHYWHLRKATIRRYAQAAREATRRRMHPNEAELYQGLPPDLWMNRRF